MARDAIVIGSGPAGVHAARALVDEGWNVTIVDGGHEAPPELRGEDPGHFEDVRRRDHAQWSWFLGRDLSNIPLDGISGGHGGGMASGNRSYVTKNAARALPVRTDNAFLIQSLAQGGLGAAWGATCALFDDAALKATGIDAPDFPEALSNVIRDIGVSGAGHPDFQPALPVDGHAAGVLARAGKGTVRFAQPPSAVLTERHGDRLPNPLTDMDYYTDAGRNVYRPQWTLNALLNRGCAYEGGYVAEHVEDGPADARVIARSIGTGETKTWTAEKVIIAAGAVNTARILLRSKNIVNVPVPIAVKPHDLVVCTDWRTLGDPGPRDRVSLCQIVGIDEQTDPHGLSSACAQLYGYRSLMLFRLLAAVPLPTPLALRSLALLTPTFVIADVRYPCYREDGHTLMLHTDGTFAFTGNTNVPAKNEQSLRHMRMALRKAGLVPLRTMKAAIGTTSHYAGTVPVSDDPADVLRCDKNGLVHGCERVHVADAAMFRCLPPLPHTLTLMANAYRVGRAIAKR